MRRKEDGEEDDDGKSIRMGEGGRRSKKAGKEEEGEEDGKRIRMDEGGGCRTVIFLTPVRKMMRRNDD